MASFLYHIFGLANTGPYYAFWSGIGGDISELAIFLGIAGLIKKHQCHRKWCWRFGHYKADDVGTLLCRKHLA